MNNKKLLAGAAVVTLSAGLAAPVQAASDTGKISAVVVAPITVSGTAAMNFGSFSVTTTGKITLDATGSITARSGSVNVPGGTIQAGSFSITADTRSTLVTIDATAKITHATVTAAKMTVTGLTFDCNSANWAVKATAATSATCSLGASPATIKTGGKLNYVAGQTPGAYSGSYTLNVGYN